MFSSILSDGVLELIGTAGLLLFILAYVLLQLGKLSGRGYVYSLLNLLAAFFVVISIYDSSNNMVALIPILWMAISIVGLYRRWAKHRRPGYRRRKQSRQAVTVITSGSSGVSSQHIDLT